MTASDRLDRGRIGSRIHPTDFADDPPACRRGLRVHGRYGGNNKGEYAQARKALDYVALDYPHARAVILMRDDDGYARRPDFEAARQTADAALAVVLAIPEPEQEAWAIVAFQPRDDAEHTRLAATRDRLAGEPRALADTLSPKQSDHPRGTKTVLAQLCDGDPTRALDALRDPPLDHLRTHGAAVGLTAFLDDIEARLTPLIGAPG